MNTLGRKKHRIVLWFVISQLLLVSCGEKQAKVQKIFGETQGTTYQITLVDCPNIIQKEAIDALLHQFDLSLSGYIPNSTVSEFNAAQTKFRIPKNDLYFLPCFELSAKIYEQTDGAFDPTVLPLMRLWGFLKDVSSLPSQQEIDSVKQFIGFEDFKLYDFVTDKKGISLVKKDPRVNFDFNAIAQGYSVDVLAEYLTKKGCENFYIEIGGEIYVQGKNPDGESWHLGVDKPVASNNGSAERVISAVIALDKGGIATSGNYRKFYEKEGKIYAHTLNPKTGYPAENELLSATVIAKNTAIADGMATAFMVMGLEKAQEYLISKDKDGLEVLFIYSGPKNSLKSFSSEGMKKRISE